MIALGLLCVLGGLGLLVAGLTQPNETWVRASIGLSLFGGLVAVLTQFASGRVPARRQTDRSGHGAPASGRAGSRPVATNGDMGNGFDVHGSGASGSDASGSGAYGAGEYGVAQNGGLAPDDTTRIREPPEESVRMGDLLTVIDLADEVLVVDGRAHYHLAICLYIRDAATVGLPINQAREIGFTPCGQCRPDSTLATQARRLRR